MPGRGDGRPGSAGRGSAAARDGRRIPCAPGVDGGRRGPSDARRPVSAPRRHGAPDASGPTEDRLRERPGRRPSQSPTAKRSRRVAARSRSWNGERVGARRRPARSRRLDAIAVGWRPCGRTAREARAGAGRRPCGDWPGDACPCGVLLLSEPSARRMAPGLGGSGGDQAASRSAARSRALRERGLAATSAADGVTDGGPSGAAAGCGRRRRRAAPAGRCSPCARPR